MRLPRLLFISVGLTSLFSAVCGGGAGEPPSGTTVKREGEPDVTYVDDDDPKMSAAKDKARSTVDQFFAALNSPKPTQSAFSVKLPIKDGEHVEHMCLTPVHFAGDKFVGLINNEPDRVTTVKLGDEAEVAKTEISNWMYVDNGKLIGGYTLRVLRDGLSAEERRKFDESVPFVIE